MDYLNDSGLSYFWSKIKSGLSGKQDTLVSGTNIKTVNGSSILGSGNLEVGAVAMTDAEVEAALDLGWTEPAIICSDTSTFYSITLDGSYGESVTTHAEKAFAGTTVTFSAVAEMAQYVTFTVTTDGGESVPYTLLTTWVKPGSTFPPEPATPYNVYTFTMPSEAVTLGY